ncbi:MAG: NarK/NasA family nitrate transporter [Candidatus Marinimicrobia bacterium]|nr:NarK/NasA family nitrate transporter [Candidatus Neomarinimicrobiota bacterium]
MSRINTWDPEDQQQWESGGKAHAMRNLWWSIPALLCAFAVWLYWSIITVQMQNLGFPFDKSQLYTLSAIAGLAGATLRIPNSFFIALSGGRNVISVTTGLLIIPAAGVGLALKNPETSYGTFVVLAALSGLGGGAFASSMSNISFFFPKRMQGLSLGLNAGLGNVGVSVMQVLLPAVMTVGIFGVLGGAGRVLPAEFGGATNWIQNSGFVWVPILLFLAVGAWFGMDNLPQHKIGSAPVAIAKMLWLLLLGFAGAATGLTLLLVLGWNMWLVLPITIMLTLLFMRYLTPRSVQENLTGQFAIFKEKHNWVMTWLYVMTFGSFIGYASAFPKLIQDVFGFLPDGGLNPNAPNPLAYAWLGPLVGSLIRPLGGWLADRFGGARVTHWDTILMIASALGVAYYIKLAGASATPEQYFMPFLLLFLLLFITTGIGNGSTFRMIPIIFKPEQAGPVLGWTSAVAAYGAFIIPRVFGGQIQLGTPEIALYGFTLYYVSCLGVNWWFYARKNAEIPC